MTSTTTKATRAIDHEAIAPLIGMCKAGQLFDVQQWIADGKPVNPPPPPEKGNRRQSPLDIAIDRGFHSLIQVLLEAGAIQEGHRYSCPMSKALEARRFDIVQLLVDHGFDPKSVDMLDVFSTWDKQIMEYFIERGADLHTDQPFAQALCFRIRTALNVYKKLSEVDAKLREQDNIALRYHCREGNTKWASLLIWAGADPFKPGADEPGESVDDDEDGGLSAVGFAALYRHYDILKLKPIRTQLSEAKAADILPFLCKGEGVDILLKLLKTGINPNDQENGGCSIVQHKLEHLADC